MSTRLKPLRKRLGFTLDALAEETGLTKSYLSKVERGLSTPSVATALKIAGALDVNVEELFSDDVDGNSQYSLVRAGSRRSFGDAGKGISYSSLTDQVSTRKILPFVIRPKAEFGDAAFKEHFGEEFLFVYRGKIEVDLHSERLQLDAGDSLHFSAQIPHRIRRLGDEDTELLIIVVGED